MILGILAAVAAPKLLATSGTATDNGLKQTLGVVRDAIERYAAEHGGTLPGADGAEATFKTEIAPYLRGPFPDCPVGGVQDDVVVMVNSVATLVGTDTAGGWKYDYVNGGFIANSDQGTHDDAAVHYDEL
jgi:type II secretory pathway pseudopilin PulG